MVYKVLFQELKQEIPVRERTKTIYVEAESEKEVRNKLLDRKLNIEFIQVLDEAHLDYERQSENFKMETV